MTSYDFSLGAESGTYYHQVAGGYGNQSHPQVVGTRTVAMSWFGRHQCGITYFLRATVPMGLTSKESIKGLAVVLAIVHMNSRSIPARYSQMFSRNIAEGLFTLHRR